jgi:hypothetical protein
VADRLTGRFNYQKTKDQLLSILSCNFYYSSDVDNLCCYLGNANVWNDICRVSATEKVAPLIHYTLNKCNINERIPADSFAILKQSYSTNFAKVTFAQNEYKKVINKMSDSEIKVVIFKGVALANDVYPNTALRSFSDMDLLVSKEQFTEACLALNDLGYKPVWDNKDRTLGKYAYNEKTFVKYKNGIPIVIDLHYSLAYLSSSVDVNGFTNTGRVLRNAVEVELCGSRANIMSAEDSIINILAHQLFECKQLPLQAYCDVAYICKKYNNKIEWKYIADVIQQEPAGEVFIEALKKISNKLLIEIPIKHMVSKPLILSHRSLSLIHI